MLMKDQHRFDHASLQLAEIIDSCVCHRPDCITQERLGESVIDFAE
jgi:radical SAM superfamily enzyme